MTKTVLGIFADREDAQEAINELKSEGYKPEDISIVMKNKEEGEKLAEDTGTDVVGGAAAGATTGAVLGGLAGLLASFVIPGLGVFFIGGPIAAALGLTGAAASAASGAATGALAGGLLGALTGFGLSDDDAKSYEESINEGGILVAVPARAGEESSVEDILSDYNADQVKSVSAETGEDRFADRPSRTADVTGGSHAPQYQPAYAAGSKGGRTKGKSTASRGRKGGRSSSRGWHGDSKEHAEAAKGSTARSRRTRE